MSAHFPSFRCALFMMRRYITRKMTRLKTPKRQKTRKNEIEIALTYFSSSALRCFAGFCCVFGRLVPFNAFHGVRFRANCVFGSIVLLRDRFLVLLNESFRCLRPFAPSNCLQWNSQFYWTCVREDVLRVHSDGEKKRRGRMGGNWSGFELQMKFEMIFGLGNVLGNFLISSKFFEPVSSEPRYFEAVSDKFFGKAKLFRSKQIKFQIASTLST